MTVLVEDEYGEAVPGATVEGTWSFSEIDSCVTDDAGLCTVVSNVHDATQINLLAFTVIKVTRSGYSYDSQMNSDANGDSDGQTIVVQRPEPLAMYVADLDGVVTTSSSDWRAAVTATVRDSSGQPVSSAKVYVTWSYGSTADCTTNSNGQCTVTSSGLKAAEVASVSLTVRNVSHNEVLRWAYSAARNGDPDGDSDGTVIVVNYSQAAGSAADGTEDPSNTSLVTGEKIFSLYLPVIDG
ncbi:MAG: Ig-like domain-containing protein [Caldilineaceae bacterium]|nr:Ig-like domain-containing protein [Caldilineaceae bacterium]